MAEFVDDELSLELPPDMQVPSWCQGAVLRYSWEIGFMTPSNNEIRGMHYKAYMALRQLWQTRVFSRALNGRLPEHPIQQSALVVVRRSSESLDWDNVFGGLKPVQDCLVKKTTKNPSGLGLIVDDNVKHMPFQPYVTQVSAAPGKGSTHFAIFEFG